MRKAVIISCILTFILIFSGCPNLFNPPREPATYTLTTNTTPSEGGTIAVDPAASEYEEGTTVNLTAVPAAGYIFVRWEGSTNTEDGTSATVKMTYNKTVTAVFAPEGTTIYQLTVSVNPAGTGTVNPGSIPCIAGEVISITAIPSTGYRFVEWQGDGSGTANPVNVTVNSDKNIIAYFEPNNWTVLIHFAIDNNIDYTFEKNDGLMTNYLSTLEAIEAADTNNLIDIVVLMDCYNTDTQGNGYVTTFQDGYYHLTGGNFNDDLIISKTEINTGLPQDTTDFMDWAITNYPAEKYVYSVFNHGGGFNDQNDEGTYAVLGIGFDDSHDDSLSHAELGQVTAYLKGLTGKNIDLFYTYACLMGGTELAYEVRNNADYMLFSEELFPADTWSYEALEAIVTDSSISGEDVGIAFCDSAYNYFNGSTPFTLSLIDLSQMDSLYNSIHSYAGTAISDIGGQADQAAYYNTAALDSFSALSLYGITDHYYIDLGDYLSKISATLEINASVKSAAASVNTSLNNAVVYHTQCYYPDASGLTIFHNIWNSDYFYYDPALYESILSFGSNDWADYISVMDSLTIPPEPDIYEPDDDFDNATLISVGALQNHTLHVTGDVDYFQVNLAAGSIYKFETYYYETNSDTILELYDPSRVSIALDDDGGSGLYSRLVYDCTISGTYYFHVVGYSGSKGDYSVDVQSGTFSSNMLERLDKINKK